MGVDLPLVLEELDAKDVGQVDDGRVLAGQGAQAQGIGVGDVRGDCPGGEKSVPDRGERGVDAHHSG